MPNSKLKKQTKQQSSLNAQRVTVTPRPLTRIEYFTAAALTGIAAGQRALEALETAEDRQWELASSAVQIAVKAIDCLDRMEG